jgi:LacI family transcriptional regulator
MRSLTPTPRENHVVPTLVQVARLAGVGLGTASRAISGDGYVKKGTLERIRRAVSQLGYQPNELARGLKTKRSNVIGLVIPDIGGPFMATCVRAIQRSLRTKGYIPIIVFTDGDEAVEAQEIDFLLRHRIDGMIIVPANGEAEHLHSARLKQIPVVAFDQPIQNAGFDAILVKNRQFAREAVNHLLGHGHKRIGCIGVFRHLPSIQRRIEGYRAAMKQAKLPPLLSIVSPNDGEIAGQLDAWFASAEPPTAIFSLNELTSTQTLEALLERGIRMPETAAFIGFDEIQFGPFLNPPITSVIQPAAEIGEAAAKRLLDRLDATNALPYNHLQLDAKLVIRGSCGCPFDGTLRLS